MLNKSLEDELITLWDAKATFQATVNSLNDLMLKTKAKKKEEVELLQSQLESIESSHRTLVTQKNVEREEKTNRSASSSLWSRST